MEYNELGQELPDPTPVAVPLKFQRQETLDEKIRRFMRNAQIQRDLSLAGFETEEEANDFDVDDDEVYIPTSHELAGLTPREMAVELGLNENIDGIGPIAPLLADPSSGGSPDSPPNGAPVKEPSEPAGGAAPT